MVDVLDSGPEPRLRRRRRWSTPLVGVLVVASAAVLAARTGGGASDRADRPVQAVEPSIILRPPPTPRRTGEPPPDGSYRLDGVPGVAPPGVRLLLGGNQPAVLDLHTGRQTALPAFGATGADSVEIRRTGRLTAALVFSAADRFTRAYALPDGGRPAALGVVRDVLPMKDGTLLTVVCVAGTGGGCVLGSRTATGAVRWQRPVPRLSTLVRETPYGVVTWVYQGDTGGLVRVEDPRTGRVVRDLGRTYTVLAADDRQVAYQRPGCDADCPVLVSSLADGSRRTLPAASGKAVTGAFSPDGRRLAIGVVGLHSEDLSPTDQRDGYAAVVDLAGGDWQLLPGLSTGPRSVPLPFWSAADDRLLVLAGDEGVNRVAAWRPGDPRAAVLPVRLSYPFLQPGQAALA